MTNEYNPLLISKANLEEKKRRLVAENEQRIDIRDMHNSLSTHSDDSINVVWFEAYLGNMLLGKSDESKIRTRANSTMDDVVRHNSQRGDLRRRFVLRLAAQGWHVGKGYLPNEIASQVQDIDAQLAAY